MENVKELLEFYLNLEKKNQEEIDDGNQSYVVKKYLRGVCSGRVELLEELIKEVDYYGF